jgi:hypothetical protein
MGNNARSRKSAAALTAAGKKAAAARHSVDTYLGSIERQAAAGELTPAHAARLRTIASIVDRAPELTPEQGAKLRAIFAEPAGTARRAA